MNWLRKLQRNVGAWIVRTVRVPHQPYEGPCVGSVNPDMYGMTVEAELHVMAGLWQEEAAFIDGYIAAAHHMMDYLGIAHAPADPTDIRCPSCRHSVWRGDRYCPTCGELLPTDEEVPE